MTNVKERVLYFIKDQKLNTENFFSELGLSYSNFKGIQKKSALNSDAIVLILSKYPSISLEWLLLGKGEMMKDNNVASVNEPSEYYENELIISLKQTIADLKVEVKELKDDKEFLKSVIKAKPGKANAS